MHLKSWFMNNDPTAPNNDSIRRPIRILIKILANYNTTRTCNILRAPRTFNYRNIRKIVVSHGTNSTTFIKPSIEFPVITRIGRTSNYKIKFNFNNPNNTNISQNYTISFFNSTNGTSIANFTGTIRFPPMPFTTPPPTTTDPNAPRTTPPPTTADPNAPRTTPPPTTADPNAPRTTPPPTTQPPTTPPPTTPPPTTQPPTTPPPTTPPPTTQPPTTPPPTTTPPTTLPPTTPPPTTTSLKEINPLITDNGFVYIDSLGNYYYVM